jgi:hypothetical protein
MDRTTRLLLVLIAGIILGFLACFGVWLVGPPIPADAQGVGVFGTAATGTRTNCAQITSPVQGQTFCFNQSTNELMVYNGAFFAPVTASAAVANISLVGAGQANLVNYLYAPTASGTTQQVGGAFTIAGAASQLIPGSAFRIALYAGAETRAGGEAILPFNVSAIARAADPVATVNMVQATLGNNQASSALACVPPACYVGVSMASTGSGIASYAFNVGGTGQWQVGYEVDAGGVATNGYAFQYKGNGANGAAAIRSDSTLQLGFGPSTIGGPGTIQLTNVHGVLGLNAAGNALIQLIESGANNNVSIDTSNAGVLIGGGVTVGGGAAGVPAAGVLSALTGVNLKATQVLWNGTTTGTPQCTNNCGTSPSVVGTNTAMRVTMGATGTPRSPFLVLFNGTWNATPACIAQLDTATTTTVSVTNASTTGVLVNTVIGPSQGGVFSIHCLGVG